MTGDCPATPPRRFFTASLAILCGDAPCCCPACERPLPPESATCPYCDEPLSAGRTRSRTRIIACGCAAVLGAAAIARAWPLSPPALPATLAAGLLLAGGVAWLLTPFQWRGFPPATRRERLAALLRHLTQRFGAALTAALLLQVMRAPFDFVQVSFALMALLASAAAATLTSRAARAGFAAGLLLGLA